MDFRKAPREPSFIIFITEHVPSGGARVSHPHLSGAGERASLPSRFLYRRTSIQQTLWRSLLTQQFLGTGGHVIMPDQSVPFICPEKDSPFSGQSISELWTPPKSIRTMLEFKMKTSKQWEGIRFLFCQWLCILCWTDVQERQVMLSSSLAVFVATGFNTGQRDGPWRAFWEKKLKSNTPGPPPCFTVPIFRQRMPHIIKKELEVIMSIYS